MIRVVKTGRNPTMRYLARTHRVSVAWLYEAFASDSIRIIYEVSAKMCADIYTKAFTDATKWSAACDLINIVDPKRISVFASTSSQEPDTGTNFADTATTAKKPMTPSPTLDTAHRVAVSIQGSEYNDPVPSHSPLPPQRGGDITEQNEKLQKLKRSSSQITDLNQLERANRLHDLIDEIDHGKRVWRGNAPETLKDHKIWRVTYSANWIMKQQYPNLTWDFVIFGASGSQLASDYESMDSTEEIRGMICFAGSNEYCYGKLGEG